MMNRATLKISLTASLVIRVATAATAAVPTLPARSCGPDAVPAGTLCLDKYEASVWRVPNPTTTNATLVRKIQLGSATKADLTTGGATQLGTERDDYAPCTNDGQNCADDIYAVSLPSDPRGAHWFRRWSVCQFGQRLPTSAGGGGERDSGRGARRRTSDCAARQHRGPHRFRSSCVTREWGLRHGGQPRGVGGRLGAARRRAWAGADSATIACASPARARCPAVPAR
jgi:hypothetical protein